jgi:hypothetical protein
MGQPKNLDLLTAKLVELPVERRRIGPVAICFIAAAALAIVFLFAVSIGWWASERSVREELAKIHAAGEPVTPADLEAIYVLPPGSHDTTELWLTACDAVTQPEYKADAEKLPFVGDPYCKMPPVDEPWPALAGAEQFLAKNADLLARLYEAASQGGQARYPTGFADMTHMVPKALLDLDSVARLLRLECEIDVRRGDVPAAIQSIRTIFALARSLELEPLPSAEFLRVAEDDAAVGCLERLLATADLADDDLALVDADLAAIDYHPQFYRTMLGKRVLFMKFFDNPQLLRPEAPDVAAKALFREADRAVYLQLMSEAVPASTATDPISLQAAMKRVYAQVAKVYDSPAASWRYPITKYLIPSLETGVDRVARGTARRDVARTAIAVERFHHANERLPESLDELVSDFLPQVPTDPFSGAPLRWAVTGDDCRIYSVGADGADQGGSIEETSAGGSDIVFRVPRRDSPGKPTTRD